MKYSDNINSYTEKPNISIEIELVIGLLMLTGQMLLESGAETYRVETSILNVFSALGGNGEINVVALGTLLTVDIFDGEHHTAIRRIRRRGVNLDKFDRINDVSRKVSEGKIGLEEALFILNELDLTKNGNKITQILGAGFVSAMFLFMIGGGICESVIAFVCCLIVQTIWVFVKKSASLVFVANIFSGFLTALIALLGALLFDCAAERIIFAALLPLFPGVAMIIAIRDIISGDLTSGVARGVEAVLTALGLALGASLGLIGISLFGEFTSNFSVITMMDLPYVIFGLLVSFGTGFMLNARLKTAAAGAVIGGVTYAVFLLCSGTAVGFFAATLTLTFFSEIVARIMKSPSTLFLIMGVYPLVPGAGIYKTAVLMLQNDIAAASLAGNATAAEFLFMVAGIAIVSVLFRLKAHKV